MLPSLFKSHESNRSHKTLFDSGEPLEVIRPDMRMGDIGVVRAERV